MLWIVFDLDTPISLLLVICLLVLLFAVSVVGCLLGYSSCLVVWIPLFLDPSDGAFGRFDLAALCGCRTLNFCLFVYVESRYRDKEARPLESHSCQTIQETQVSLVSASLEFAAASSSLLLALTQHTTLTNWLASCLGAAWPGGLCSGLS